MTTDFSGNPLQRASSFDDLVSQEAVQGAMGGVPSSTLPDHVCNGKRVTTDDGAALYYELVGDSATALRRVLFISGLNAPHDAFQLQLRHTVSWRAFICCASWKIVGIAAQHCSCCV